MLYHVALFFHIVSIFLVAGGGIGAVPVEAILWKRVFARSRDAENLFPFFESKTKMIKVGIVLFLISGTTLLYSTGWIYLKQPTPLFREYEKQAVRIGGGYNLRMGLYDMIMLKDNHMDFVAA